MKLLLLLTATFVILFSACNDRTLEQLNQRNEELAKVKRQRDSVLNQMDSALMALEKSLGVKEGEISKNISERIKNDIAFLENMIQENDKKVQSLRYQNRNSNNQNKELLAELETNQQELLKRQSDLESINQQVTRMNQKIRLQDSANIRLGNLNTSQSRKVEELNQRLNTAYIIVGKFKDLKEKELVEKKGGFLNLFGREPKLDPNYNKGLFATINIRKDTVLSFNLPKKDLKFVTVHPTESFELVQSDESHTQLSIKNPDRFWEASKFLVIEEK